MLTLRFSSGKAQRNWVIFPSLVPDHSRTLGLFCFCSSAPGTTFSGCQLPRIQLLCLYSVPANAVSVHCWTLGTGKIQIMNDDNGKQLLPFLTVILLLAWRLMGDLVAVIKKQSEIAIQLIGITILVSSSP